MSEGPEGPSVSISARPLPQNALADGKAQAGESRARIVLIATGGTLAMQQGREDGACIPALAGEDLVQSVAGIDQLAVLEVQDLANQPSAYMGPVQWGLLAEAVQAAMAREEISAVVVTHGTDTLEETAYFLELTLPGNKPVVLVGAQRSASEPDSDGPRNLLDAVRVAVATAARGRGVLVVMNGRISAARDISKVHTCDVAGFSGGEAGYLGDVGPHGVRFRRAESIGSDRQLFPLGREPLPKVAIVTMYGGADGSLVEAAVASGASGIVVQALGAGNVNPAVFTALKEVMAKGVTVVIATRVPHGRVMPVYGFEGGGKTLVDAGAILAGDLSPQKARILLMLALQQGAESAALQRLFD